MKNAPNTARSRRTLRRQCIAGVIIFAMAQPALAGPDPTVIDSETAIKNEDTKSPAPPAFRPNQLVIKMKSYATMSSILGRGGSTVALNSATSATLNSGAYLLQFDTDIDVEDAATELSALDQVEYAHPNYVLDSLHPVQSSLPFSDRLGVGNISEQPPAQLLSLSATHQTVRGDDVTIGAIDGGVDGNHEFLSDCIQSGFDYIDGDYNPYDEPGGAASGHGTFVAGVIHLGAPEATIRSYRIFDANGRGDGFTLARAIEQAALDGCDIINLSVVLVHEHEAVNNAIDFAIERGAVVVAAAGNQGNETPLFPAAYPAVLSVGAVDDSALQLTEFSSYGPTIDVCAPGKDIYSAFQSGEYAWWSGTSFAAPFVTAQAALLRERHPAASSPEISAAIVNSATGLEPSNPEWTGGVGSGLVDFIGSMSLLDSMVFTTSSASIFPSSLDFQVNVLGPEVFQASAYLSSLNSPAAYSVEINSSAQPYVRVLSSNGNQTNDNVTIIVLKDQLPATGATVDTVTFLIDGVTDPVELIVNINVHQEAWFSYDTSPSFHLEIGSGDTVNGCVSIFSSNQPANYTIEIPETSHFLHSAENSGVTGGSHCFEFYTEGPGLPLGRYFESALVWVDGVPEPLKVRFALSIDRSSEPTTAISWVSPPSLYVTAPTGVDTVITRDVNVYSSNSPAAYQATLLDQDNFLTIVNPLDSTHGTLSLEILALAAMEPGLYYDSVLVAVEGVNNSPLLVKVTLNLDSTLIPPVEGDTAWAEQNVNTYQINTGVDFTTTDYIRLFSTNAPSSFTATVRGSGLITVPGGSGVTGDSLQYTVTVPATQPVGLYSDTILVSVDGVVNSPVAVVVQVDVVSDGYTSWLQPSTLSYSITAGDTSVIRGAFWVNSNNLDPGFTAELQEPAHVTTLLTTSGIAPDSIRFEIEPPAYLEPGYYVDKIEIVVEGVSNPILIAQVALHVDSAAGPGEVFTINGSSLALYTATAGETVSLPGWTFVTTSEDPIPFLATTVSESEIIDLPDSVGLTGDTLYFSVTSNPSLSAGVHTDSILIILADVEYTVTIPIELTVVDGGAVESVSLGNYPNPFNPTTTIAFALPFADQVEITVYNVLGQEVATLVDDVFPAGRHVVVWDGSQVASGVYFYRLKTSGATISRKMILLK